MRTLLDNHSGLPLAWTGLLGATSDILRPTGTGLGKHSTPLCEGEGTTSSTWTQTSTRAQGLACKPTAGSQPSPSCWSVALCCVQATQLSWYLQVAEPFWKKLLKHLYELGLGKVGELEVWRLSQGGVIPLTSYGLWARRSRHTLVIAMWSSNARSLDFPSPVRLQRGPPP